MRMKAICCMYFQHTSCLALCYIDMGIMTKQFTIFTYIMFHLLLCVYNFSDSKGVPIVRQEFASFLQKRDGFASDIDNIFLCNGASEAVRLFMT